MGLKSILANIKNRGLKDVTSTEKIKNYFNGLKVKEEGIHLDYDEIMSYSEQLVYRSIKCRSCFKAGKCHDCQCPQPLAAMVVDHNCSTGNYSAMLSPQDWEEYKKDLGLKFKLDYEPVQK